MTAPQPDTETLVARVTSGLRYECDSISLAIGEGCGQCLGCVGYAAAHALAARLAETEAQRDDALRALIAEVRQVAALEAALRDQAWETDDGLCWCPESFHEMEQDTGYQPDATEHSERCLKARAALDSLPSLTSWSSKDDDIVYVDMQGGPTLYLITVREAHVQAAAGEDPQADREKVS